MSAASHLHAIAASIAKRISLFQGLCSGGRGDGCRCHDGNGSESCEQRVELHCGFETCASSSLRDWGEWVEWVGYFIRFTQVITDSELRHKMTACTALWFRWIWRKCAAAEEFPLPLAFQMQFRSKKIQSKSLAPITGLCRYARLPLNC